MIAVCRYDKLLLINNIVTIGSRATCEVTNSLIFQEDSFHRAINLPGPFISHYPLVS